MNRVDHVDILRFQFPDSCDTMLNSSVTSRLSRNNTKHVITMLTGPANQHDNGS